MTPRIRQEQLVEDRSLSDMGQAKRGAGLGEVLPLYPLGRSG